jgi:radical SAM protein with 4Fe4S-binding SPASM domain
LNFKESNHDENLQFCWAQRFNATIDKSGNVFPCPQVALKDYLNLRYGNIKERRFWDIWNSEERKRMLKMSVKDMKCRVCDRKDEAINRELAEILKTARYCLINQDRKSCARYSVRR